MNRELVVGASWIVVGVLVLGISVWAVTHNELAGPPQLVLIPFALGAGFIAIGVTRLGEATRKRPPKPAPRADVPECQPLHASASAAPVSWTPTSREELDEIVSRELAECSAELRMYFERVRTTPEKWHQTPYGELGGGFWVLACDGTRVLWFNDIEDGWNVSEFVAHGRIPNNQYWCNQDELRFALPRLARGEVGGLGPPTRLSWWGPSV